MKIAMLLSCDSFQSFFGNVLNFDHERYVKSYRHDFSWYYAKGLLENGVKPTLYIPSLTHSGRHETELGVGIRFLKVAPWYRPLAKLRRAFRATRGSLYLQERMNAIAFQNALDAGIVEDGIDLVYMQEYWGGRFDHLVHRCRVPVAAFDQGGLAKGVVKIFKRPAMEAAAAIYSQTVSECETVREYGGAPILSPNGADTEFFRPPPPGTVRNKTILTVARLTDKQKRTSDLIRAVGMLSSDWTLNIAGTGPDRVMLESLTKELGLENRVNFLGFKSREEIRDLVQHCGVYAMPSSNEGVCLAVLEAMSCGAATVTTNIRAFVALIENGISGITVPVANPRKLAEAIENAWADRDRLGRNAVERIDSHFDSRKLYRQLAQTLRKAAAKDRPSVGTPLLAEPLAQQA